jgi:hypothetical protein
MCRVRKTHTTAPWTTAFVCITIDDSCLDENGKFVDKPMTVRMVQWQPFCVTKPFDPKTPVCAACKRTNRTRSFCRERHKHRQLPWCTVYVLLSTLDAADPSTVVAGASQKVTPEEANGEGKPAAASGDAKATKTEEGGSTETETVASDAADNADATDAGEVEDPGDDINAINENRTFLAKVSSRSTTIHWLELAEYDSSEAAPFPGVVPVDAQQQYHPAMIPMPPHAMDPNQPPSQQYYQQNMNYAAQQHQNALKSRQQYFFQMQQQHQYMPPGPPGMQPGHWQQAPYAIALPGPPGEPSSVGATAGEAAAAQQRRGGPGSPDDMQQFQPLQQQHWAAMYYQGHPGIQFPQPPQDGTAQTPSQNESETGGPDENENFHTPPESTNGDDGPDDKRQRTV